MFLLHEPLERTLREKLSAYDDLTAALLIRRGIDTKEKADKFLSPSYEEDLHDPLLMVDMPKAAKRLASAIATHEHIAVWSDYDCDGIPGGIILHDFLKKVGAHFENYIPHRQNEGYGMNEVGIMKLAKNGVTLIITVDSGITDVAEISCAKKLGIDVIVTDHHLPGEKLPDAYAVVNPNARSDETYPFKDLCGAGVAWKLVCATLAVAPVLREKVPEGWEKWLLDMVGLATIADMVPLTGENRVLAVYGLLVLRKSPRIGLQKMCRIMRTEQRTLTEDDIGFMIAPRVNAASRMSDPRDAFDLFTSENEDEADTLAKNLEKANRSRKAKAGAITRAVRTRIKEREELRSVIALGDPEWNPALLGLVANTIADEYGRPVFLWGRGGNQSLKGSVRSGGGVHALKLMQATKNVFERFGGHAASGGFTVKDDMVFFLEEHLSNAFKEIPKSESDDLTLRADARCTIDEVTTSFLHTLEKLSPFGRENSKPVFLLHEVSVLEISHFGKSKEHLKIILRSNKTKKVIESIAFFVKKPITKVAEQCTSNTRVDILAHIERNPFSYRYPIRLRILDLHLIQVN